MVVFRGVGIRGGTNVRHDDLAPSVCVHSATKPARNLSLLPLIPAVDLLTPLLPVSESAESARVDRVYNASGGDSTQIRHTDRVYYTQQYRRLDKSRHRRL